MAAAADLCTMSVELNDDDAIEHFLREAFGSMRMHRGEGPVRLRFERLGSGVVAVETAHQTAELTFDVDPLHRIVVTRASTARLERIRDGHRHRDDVGDLSLVSDPERPYAARWLPGELQSCTLDPSVLAQVAAAAPGRRPAPIRFTGFSPSRPAAANHWWAIRSYVADLLADPESAAHPLLVAGAARLLAAATLATFPNTAVLDPTAVDRQDAHPEALRRAVAFIDENAHRDISLADIAAAARISIRGVQLAFRRHLDVTPTRYLRGVRLDHAHRALRAADPAGSTVGTIAARWGFADRGRFAALYRHTYGRTPQATLREGTG